MFEEEMTELQSDMVDICNEYSKGLHNITNHNGGRSEGMWADAPR